MKFSAEQIAGLINGVIVGDSAIEVNSLAKIEEGKKGDLSFLSNMKYEEFIYSTGSSVCIVNNSFNPSKVLPSTLTLIKVEDAYKAFSKVLEFYNQVKNNKLGREEPNYISNSATIGKDEYIGAFSYIGENVKVGTNVKIYPNVF